MHTFLRGAEFARYRNDRCIEAAENLGGRKRGTGFVDWRYTAAFARSQRGGDVDTSQS